MSRDKDYIHKVFPKQFARDEFWAQIKRTVNGKPVSEEQIQLIVDKVADELALDGRGHLLDLGCGNAALASRFFDRIESYTGVDFSSYLLEIAEEFFHPHEKVRYVMDDVAHFAGTAEKELRFDRVLCYGCMSYLDRDAFVGVMRNLAERFPDLRRGFIGNIPDRSRAADFFARRPDAQNDLDDPQSPIGVWWDAADLGDAMRDVGFLPRITRMPEGFYGAAYRFDLTVTR